MVLVGKDRWLGSIIALRVVGSRRKKIKSVPNQTIQIGRETHSNQQKAALCIRKYAKKPQKHKKRVKQPKRHRRDSN
jgi:hypothetical protein